MATKSGAGHSFKRTEKDAAKEAIEQAMHSAGMTKCDLVIVFATVGYNQAALISSIRQITDDARLIGCTGEGVISYDFINESPFALSIMVIQSDEMSFEVEKVTSVKENCANAGKVLGKKIKPHTSSKTKCLWLELFYIDIVQN